MADGGAERLSTNNLEKPIETILLFRIAYAEEPHDDLLYTKNVEATSMITITMHIHPIIVRNVISIIKYFTYTQKNLSS